MCLFLIKKCFHLLLKTKMFSKHCAGHELLPKYGCNKNSIRAGLLCLGEARVPTGTGPLLLLYQQKIDPEAQGPSPLRSPFPPQSSQGAARPRWLPVTRQSDSQTSASHSRLLCGLSWKLISLLDVCSWFLINVHRFLNFPPTPILHRGPFLFNTCFSVT